MNDMYKVFQIDISFSEYDTNYVYLGGRSISDIQEHFDDIFPPTEFKVKYEDWMTDDDWNLETKFGKYKDGDTYFEPFFSPEEYDEFMKEDQVRIKETRLFTDTLYEIVHTEV